MKISKSALCLLLLSLNGINANPKKYFGLAALFGTFSIGAFKKSFVEHKQKIRGFEKGLIQPWDICEHSPEPSGPIFIKRDSFAFAGISCSAACLNYLNKAIKLMKK